MNREIKLINIKEEILSENKGLADKIREHFEKKKVFYLNIMGSPGSGKTSLIMKTIEALGEARRARVTAAERTDVSEADLAVSRLEAKWQRRNVDRSAGRLALAREAAA